MIPLGDRWALLQGDALSVAETLPDASVDAWILDPPYCSGAVSEARRTRANGQGLRSSTINRFGWFVGDNMGTAGLVWLLRSLAWEALRTAKPTGHLVVFCDWRMLATLQPAIESTGWRWQALLVWDKGSMGLGNGFRHQHELALHFTAGSPEFHDLSVGDVLRVSRVGRDDREHQTQKPTALLAPIVRVTTPPNGMVVDPFCGSGSTGKAALDEGRRFLGIDRDAAALEVARRMLSGLPIRRGDQLAFGE